MPEPQFDVTTFGEMLLRLSVPPGERLETARQLDVHPAGAEANVVTLLARLNCRTLWMGALPDNPMGRLAASSITKCRCEYERRALARERKNGDILC